MSKFCIVVITSKKQLVLGLLEERIAERKSTQLFD